jgi:ribonuclease HI
MGQDYGDDDMSCSESSESSSDMEYGSSDFNEDEEMEEEEQEQDLDWYHAVVIGRCRGIFTSSYDAMRFTRRYFSATSVRFPTFEEAHELLTRYGLAVDSGFEFADGSKFWFAYAMNSGSGDFPDPLHPSSLVAFCGGSALRNGKPDCEAAYACVFPHQRGWDVVKKVDDGVKPTCNRAEYLAALAALERANLEDPHKTTVLFIYSHCKLLVKTMNKWIYKWRNNGWRTVDGEDIQNQDLLEKLMAAQGTRRVQWRKVRAHTKGRNWVSFWNDIASAQARGESAHGQHLAPVNLDGDNIMYLRERHGDDLVAFCAGSAPQNGFGVPVAYAVSFPLEGSSIRANRLDVRPTSNRANLLAAKEAMIIADELDVDRERTLVIYSRDRNLVSAMGADRWVDNWEMNGWRKANRKPVQNRDIYQELLNNDRSKEWRFLDVAAEPVWLSSFHDEAHDEAERAARLANAV